MTRPLGALSVPSATATLLWGRSLQCHIQRAPKGCPGGRDGGPWKGLWVCPDRHLFSCRSSLPSYLQALPHYQAAGASERGLGPLCPADWVSSAGGPGLSPASAWPRHTGSEHRGKWGTPTVAPASGTSQPALSRGCGWASQAPTRRGLCQPLRGPLKGPLCWKLEGPQLGVGGHGVSACLVLSHSQPAAPRVGPRDLPGVPCNALNVGMPRKQGLSLPVPQPAWATPSHGCPVLCVGSGPLLHTVQEPLGTGRDSDFPRATWA